jgi:hypothetical protein
MAGRRRERTAGDAARYTAGEEPAEDAATVLADAAVGRRDPFRIGRQELRTFAALDVTQLRRRADDVARQTRELDLAIEQVNFATDVEYA